MKVTDVRTHVLVVPAVKADATTAAQDDFVVEIETDEGIVEGVGESDLNPWIARGLRRGSQHAQYGAVIA